MFDLHSYAAERRARIDRALDACLPPAELPPATLHEAMRYGVFGGGKRLRPMICLAAAEAVGAAPEAALTAAAAVELLHNYTLIHDDLPCMDDDAMRRGQPTCHRRFGAAVAVLAGDALQALAFELAARQTAPPSLAPGRLVLELACAAGSRGVVGGQVADLAADGATANAQQIAFIHRHKTADLFRAAVRLGALAGGADEAALETLTRYGVGLGLAYQIVDDLLDAPAPGRPPDPSNCLRLYGVQEALRRARLAVAGAVEALEGLRPAGAEPLAAVAHFALHQADPAGNSDEAEKSR